MSDIVNVSDVSDDLLARVRTDLAAAKENGHDLLADHRWTDEGIADDMADSTGAYEFDTHEAHVAAVAMLRAERFG